MPVNYDCQKCGNARPCARHATREEFKRQHPDRFQSPEAKNEGEQSVTRNSDTAAHDPEVPNENPGAEKQRATAFDYSYQDSRISVTNTNAYVAMTLRGYNGITTSITLRPDDAEDFADAILRKVTNARRGIHDNGTGAI